MYCKEELRLSLVVRVTFVGIFSYVVCLIVCMSLAYLESPRLSTSSGRRPEAAPAPPPLLASLRGLVADETGAMPPMPPPAWWRR